MSTNSFNIVLADINTRLPRTGLTVKLRWHKDNFASNIIDCPEVSGKPGEYLVENYTTARYRMWVNGSPDPSWGGTAGRPLISDEDLLLLSSGRWDFKGAGGKNLGDPTADGDPISRGWLLANFFTETEINALLALKVSLAGTQTVTGLKNFEIIPKIVPTDALPGVIPDPSLPGELIHFKYFHQVLSTIGANPNQQSSQLIRVFGGATVEIGKLYPNIKDAVARAFTGTPAATKVYSIAIENMGPAEYMNAVSGSLKSFVNLVAAGRHIKIIMQDDSTLAECTISNATLFFGGNDVTTDREFQKLCLDNCTVYHFKNLTFRNSESIRNTRFVGASGKQVTFDLATNVEGCWLNADPDVSGCTGNTDYQKFTGYTLPGDPSIGS